MDNEVIVQVDRPVTRKSEAQIVRQIAKMPGVEMVDVNLRKGLFSVTGGDLDQMHIMDAIESAGYTALY